MLNKEKINSTGQRIEQAFLIQQRMIEYLAKKAWKNLITGYASGVVYTQSFINTDEGLRAKVCRDAGEQQ